MYMYFFFFNVIFNSAKCMVEGGWWPFEKQSNISMGFFEDICIESCF